MNRFPPLIAPVHQGVWGAPAVVNLCAGGAGTALYGLSFMLPPCGPALMGLPSVYIVRLFCALLVAVGFAAVGIESRKPLNARYLLCHLKNSWMSREVLVGGLFILLVVLDVLTHNRWLEFASLAMAMLLLVCQVMMVYDTKGMEVWNTWMAMIHGFSSNLHLACGLLLIFCSFAETRPIGIILTVVFVTLGVNFLAWWMLLLSRFTKDLRPALSPLITPIRLTFSIGVGHMLPALLLLVVIGLQFKAEVNTLTATLFAVSGTMIVIGGIAQKEGIMLYANTLKAIRPGMATTGRFINNR